MTKAIQAIKSLVNSLTKNQATIEEENNSELKFIFNNNRYLFSINDEDEIDCKVIFRDESGNPYIIDNEKSEVINKRLTKDHDNFLIVTDEELYIEWKFDQYNIDDQIKEILSKSDVILINIIQVIEEVSQSISDTNTSDNNTSDTNEGPHTKKDSQPDISSTIKSLFEKQEWNAQYDINGNKFKIATGFSTKKYTNSDQDKGFKLFIRGGENDEVIFHVPFAYNLHKDIKEEVKSETKHLRQIKLALKNLKITSTRKFITMQYDEDDGEIAYEIRILTPKDQTFSEDQALRSIRVIQQSIDEFHSDVMEVLDDTVSSEVFAQKLFPETVKNSKLDSLKEMLTGQSLDLDSLNNEQLDALINEISNITSDMLSKQTTEN